MNKSIIRVNTLALNETSNLVRLPNRPAETLTPEYLDRFDSLTLAYDVFEREGRHWFVGPSTLNLKRIVRRNFPFMQKISGRAYFQEFSKSYEAFVSPKNKLDDAAFKLDGGNALTGKVSPSGLSLFRDKKVLFAISKNNKLKWIRDWAKFYVDVHGVNALLLYDNGSTEYGLDELLSAIGVKGLEVAVVVDWPFKYGSTKQGQGDKWDSNFCQRSMFVHARRRFLDEAAYAINQDVDELLVTTSGKSIFELVDNTPEKFITYPGRWIESPIIGNAADGRDLSFRDYGYFDTDSYRCHSKWAIAPSRTKQVRNWSVHKVAGMPRNISSEAEFRHFRAISTGWKAGRLSESDDEAIGSKLELDKSWRSIAEQLWF